MSSRVFLLLLFFLAGGALLTLLLTPLQDQGIRVSRAMVDYNAPPRVDPTCFTRLRAKPGVRLSLTTDFERTPGCLVEGAVLVRELAGVELRPREALMRCEVAEALHNWLERSVKPQALATLNSPVTHMRHIGTYNCRRIAGSRNLSQHSFANAVDVSAFRLASGKQLKLLSGWDASDGQVRAFWRKVQRGSCRHFSVSLGPAYNAAHRDHFHFDLGPARICR